jgi:hypothetical protein
MGTFLFHTVGKVFYNLLFVLLHPTFRSIQKSRSSGCSADLATSSLSHLRRSAVEEYFDALPMIGAVLRIADVKRCSERELLDTGSDNI